MNSLEVMMVANKLSLNEDRLQLYNSEIVESRDSSQWSSSCPCRDGTISCAKQLELSPHEPEAAHTRASLQRIHAPKPFPATRPGQLSRNHKTAASESHSRNECIATVLSEQVVPLGSTWVTIRGPYVVIPDKSFRPMQSFQRTGDIRKHEAPTLEAALSSVLCIAMVPLSPFR